MKNCLKCSLTLLFLFAFMSLHGQIKFGPKAGVNLATMTLKSSGISIDPTMQIGFHVGLISEISITDNLVVQPGIFYSTKGSKYKISYLQQSYESSISPAYVDIPINLNYYFGTGNTKIAFFAGPYIAYGIGGKAKSDGESADISFGNTEDNDMKPLDFGVNIGAGVNLNGLLISAQYGLGLANLIPTTSGDEEMKNRVIGISLTYLLGGK